MSAVQQQDKIAFATGRLFATPVGGGARKFYGDLTDISVDIKVDLKQAYGEGQFPIAVADGHRSIDIQAKHYTLRLDALANDLGQSAPTSSATAFSYDEAGIVPGGLTYTLNQSASYLANSAVVKVFYGTNKGPIFYNLVASGSEVSGVSCSITNGVLKFNAADVGLAFQVTYQYADTAGQQITIVNSFQGSTTAYSMVLAKRDLSPIDGSIGQLIFTLNAVRFGGIKMDYKEGDFTVYERSFQAFADPTGTIGYLQFVNTTTSNTP